LVPAGHRASGGATPAAEGLHRLGELEEMSAGARHVRDDRKRGLPGRLVTELGGHREREDRRIVARRAARVRDVPDALDRLRAVLPDAAQDRFGVFAGQRALARVVAAALTAKDEEA